MDIYSVTTVDKNTIERSNLEAGRIESIQASHDLQEYVVFENVFKIEQDVRSQLHAFQGKIWTRKKNSNIGKHGTSSVRQSRNQDIKKGLSQ